jgi:DNA-binding NtrC family response regulator
MPGMNGHEVLDRIKGEHPDTVVIVITGYASVESAVEAMKRGAYDFVPKPFTPNELRAIVTRALEKRRLLNETAYLRRELRNRIGADALCGETPPIGQIKELIRKAGQTDSTVLITGESGTGKELVARALHYHSRRRGKPFVVVDTASLVENLVESELFGHVKGAFTGAQNGRRGRFELAHHGTVFLDEIGNIDLRVQGKLLRVIQEREFSPVGSAGVVPIDVRIIVATNMNLTARIDAGSFREDLYYRLSVIPIHLPPLRSRKEDIPLLVNHFIAKYNRRRSTFLVEEFSPEAMEILMTQEWPGNVRELENVVERAVVLAGTPIIQPSDLFPYTRKPPRPESAETESVKLADVERQHIQRILHRFDGNRNKCSEALGIDRKTLRSKIIKYGLGAEMA